MSNNSNSPKLFKIKDWPHAWPTETGFRYFIHNRKSNGFDKVILKVGKHVLIDEKKFFEWVEERNKEKSK